MENDLQVKYDALCYATFINVRHKSHGAERIVFRNFDHTNKEHLFVMSVTMACAGVLGDREVAVDCGLLARKALNKQYQNSRKIGKARDDEDKYIDVPEMLEFMRGPACESCGVEFTFGDIYDAYYNKKETR